jgi:hypothetical protein
MAQPNVEDVVKAIARQDTKAASSKTRSDSRYQARTQWLSFPFADTTCSCGGTDSMCSSMNSALRILCGTVSRWNAPQACGPTLSSGPGVPAKAQSASDRNIVSSTALITLSIHLSCASGQFMGSVLCCLLPRAPFRRQTSLALTCNQSAEPGISFKASYRLFSKDVAIRRIRTVVSGNRHLLEEDAVMPVG